LHLQNLLQLWIAQGSGLKNENQDASVIHLQQRQRGSNLGKYNIRYNRDFAKYLCYMCEY